MTKATDARVAGISTKYGEFGFSFLFHWIFAHLAPSGNGFPLPGMPSL